MQAREELSLASLFSGLALAIAKSGAVHGFAGVLGGMYSAPHGAICAALLVPVISANITALQDAPGHPAQVRYREIAGLLTGDPAAAEQQGAAWVRSLCAEFAVPGLRRYGVTTADFPAIVAKTRLASSTQGYPVILSEAQLRDIIEKSL
jgi:alcohol dehydrogenase class IV